MYDNDPDYFHYMSDSEHDSGEAILGAKWAAEEGRCLGAWLVTSRDAIIANPFYKGAPVPHPEDYQDDDDYS